MDDAAWMALTLALTVAGLLYTWWGFRNRGAATGTRGLALSLLPVAAWLTGTLEMFTEISASITDWATGLVLSPKVWAGAIAAGLAVVLWVIGGFLHGRNEKRAGNGSVAAPRGADPAKPLPKSQPRKDASPLGDDMDEIEAILKSRGIS